MAGLFIQRLRHWALHVSLCAAPSFILAYQFGYNTRYSIAGMVCGVVLFIVGYAWVTSRRWFGGNGDSRFALAVRYGTRVRTGISVVAMVGVVLSFWVLGVHILYAPDLYAGVLAALITGFMGLPTRFEVAKNESFYLPPVMDFLSAFSTTVIEGLVMSGSLFVLVLILFACTPKGTIYESGDVGQD